MEVTVGLASHCPCVTHNSALSTYGLHGLCQAPTLLLGYGPSFIVLHSDNTDKDDRQTIQSND